MPDRYTCPATRARPGLPPLTRQRAPHAQPANGVCITLTTNSLTDTVCGFQGVMNPSLGSSWRSSFAEFNPIPFSAASIGQVHHAILAAAVSPMGQPERVERPGLHPNTPNHGAAAPARAIPGQNACCTVLHALSSRAANRGS